MCAMRLVGTSQDKRRISGTDMATQQNKSRSHVASRRMSPSAPRSEGYYKGMWGMDNSGYGTQDEIEMKMALDDFDATQY